MNSWNYPYVHIPHFNGELLDDVRNLLGGNKKEKTFDHALAVAKTNVQIAERYGLEIAVCMASGLLHDISAVIHPDDMLTYAQNSDLYIDESEKRFPFLLHQRLSRMLAEELFGVDDQRILSAIECHSTLKSNPTDYDMALFVADKLSWDKDGTPPYYNAIVDGLNKSLGDASLAYMNYIIDNKIILYPHLWFTEGKRFLESNSH